MIGEFFMIKSNKIVFIIFATSFCFSACEIRHENIVRNHNEDFSSDVNNRSTEYQSSSTYDDASKLEPTDNILLPTSNVEDEQIINYIFNCSLDYSLSVPGAEISYNVLWTGYDLENNFGTKISPESRFYTYLTNYEANQDSFYLLYLKKSDIEQSNEWLINYKNNKENDYRNYHFCDNEMVIDGKYLLYAQKNNVKTFSVYQTSNPLNMPFTFENWQLAMCLQSKSIEIEENVSLKKNINKTLTVFRRYELVFDEFSHKMEQYSFDSQEKYNVNIVDNIFSYQGKRIETYPENFESMSYCYCPIMGMVGLGGLINTKRADLLENRIILPRYYMSNGETPIDLLSSSSDFSFIEDVFRNFKNLFLDAYVKDCDYEGGLYKYGLFSYDKVEQIIKGVE